MIIITLCALVLSWDYSGHDHLTSADQVGVSVIPFVVVVILFYICCAFIVASLLRKKSLTKAKEF